MPGNRLKRLERLEKKYADLARQEALANCTCQPLTFATSTEIFEAEMNKTCPADGLRRLRRKMIVYIVPTRKDRADSVDEGSVGLRELVKEYQRRLAEFEQAESELRLTVVEEPLPTQIREGGPTNHEAAHESSKESEPRPQRQ